MDQNQLSICPQLNFTCDSCGRKFENETAYSPASNLEELKHQPIYCVDCVNITKEEPKKKRKWETPPLEASENLTSLNIDRRSLTKTGRTYQLGTRVRKEFLEELKKIAYGERLKMVEVLERALESYKRERSLAESAKQKQFKIIPPKIKLPLTPYSHQNFACDKCQRGFKNQTAYSPASSLKQLKGSPTYCKECV